MIEPCDQTAVLLGGPTGVGKTTTLKHLHDIIPKCAVLDADDVWRIRPELQVDGTRAIAIANTVSVMKGYFEAGCEVGILTWVFARPELYAPVVEAFDGLVGRVKQIYLVSDEATLEKRLRQRGESDRLEYSISRLHLIENLPFRKIDTSEIDPIEVAQRVKKAIDEDT